MVVNQNASSGRELYGKIWKVLGTRFYDVSRLANWKSWKHCYDDVIIDDNSALRYADKMVASLNDEYTCLIKPEKVGSRHAYQKRNKTAVIAEHLPGNIGCLSILDFSQNNMLEQVAQGLERIADCAGFLVVLANNSGGLVDQAIDCLEPFVEEGGITSLELSTGKGVKTQYVYFAPHASLICTTLPGAKETMQWFGRKKAIVAGKPVAVVINGDTASAAEIFAEALLHNGKATGWCRSYGTRSRGKGITQEPFKILGGRAKLQISTGRVLSPSQRWFGDAQTDCRGIEPDVYVDGGDRAIRNAALRDLRRRIGQKAAWEVRTKNARVFMS
jgi:C-terminal processing protease CtpA/Prc